MDVLDHQQPAKALSPLKIWWLAARPATLTAALAPVAVGGALALRDGRAAFFPWLAALVGAIFIQLGTNFANDVFDFEKGADTAARKGPLRVTQAGLVSPAQVKRAMWLAFVAATLCGMYLVSVAGAPIVWLGLASIASGIAYTGGPFPLGYLGLGDIFVFAFFGVAAVCGTYFVQSGDVDVTAFLYSLPVGATCTAILVVNNLRDIDTDVIAGKKTLAVRFGARAARWEYTALWVAAAAVPLLMAGLLSLPYLLLPVLLFPFVARLVRRIWSTSESEELNKLLGATAKFHLLNGLLIAISLVIAWILR